MKLKGASPTDLGAASGGQSTPAPDTGTEARGLAPTYRADARAPTRASDSPPLRRILVVSDLVGIAIGSAAAVAAILGLTQGQPVARALLREGAIAPAVVAVAAAPLIMRGLGLYRRSVCVVRRSEMARSGVASLAYAAMAVAILWPTGLGSAAAAGTIGGVAWFLSLTGLRSLLREWIHVRRGRGDFSAPIVVVAGSADAATGSAALVRDHPALGFEVRGVVCPDRPADLLDGTPWLGVHGSLPERVRGVGAAGALLDASSLTGDELNTAVEQLSLAGLHAHVSTGLTGIDSRRTVATSLVDETFLHISPLRLTTRQLVAKRIMDIVLGSIALAGVAPLLAIAALAIRLSDGGPVLFTQERVGRDGKRFRLHKLRTMIVDADRMQESLAAQNERSGPLFKMTHDPRVTPLGRILRATSIDELPQLINVLQGSMSLVGPRPALAEEVERFDDDLAARMTVKPGLTGMWQVEARDQSSFDLYRRYDMLYVRNWSVMMDLGLIARTSVLVAMRSWSAVFGRSNRSGGVLD